MIMIIHSTYIAQCPQHNVAQSAVHKKCLHVYTVQDKPTVYLHHTRHLRSFRNFTNFGFHLATQGTSSGRVWRKVPKGRVGVCLNDCKHASCGNDAMCVMQKRVLFSCLPGTTSACCTCLWKPLHPVLAIVRQLLEAPSLYSLSRSGTTFTLYHTSFVSDITFTLYHTCPGQT